MLWVILGLELDPKGLVFPLMIFKPLQQLSSQSARSDFVSIITQLNLKIGEGLWLESK
jgi:hypothetical protein